MTMTITIPRSAATFPDRWVSSPTTESTQTGRTTFSGIRDEVTRIVDDYFSGRFPDYARCSYYTVADISDRFHELVSQWNDERRFLSSPKEMTACVSFKLIIALGPAAVPLIVDQLRNEENSSQRWELFLMELTSANPVTRNDYGKPRRIAGAWLAWAERNGF